MVKFIIDTIVKACHIFGRALTTGLRPPRFIDDDWPSRKKPRG